MEKQILTNEYETRINTDQAEMFKKYRQMILEYNERYNLTTILDEKDMFYKHFLDSVLGESFFKANARVAEIGSGAGFPSIPLKILRPDLQFDLFESVGKKCEFLRAVVDNLGLEGVRVFNMRAEDCAKDGKFREQYDHATARAVARMNTLCEYCLPFVKVGGSFVAYKSAETEELYEAKNACKVLGGKLSQIYTASLPLEYGNRSIAIVEKLSHTPAKYPRGQGKERKNPL